MERQVHQRCHGRVSTLRGALPVLVLSLTMMLPVYAGTLTGGATEWTQIANNIQLMQSYAEQVNTVRNTLQSARSLQQQLKQLDPRVLDSLTSDSYSDVRRMADMADRLNDVMRSSERSAAVLQRALQEGQSRGMAPDEYLRTRAELARVRGGAYEQSYEADQKQLADTQNQMAALQKSAAAAHGVTSNVQGFQQMLASGTRVQAQLITLNANVTKTNMLMDKAAHQAEMDKNAKFNEESAREKERAALEAEGWKKLDERKISLPSPMNYVPKDGQ